MIKLAEVKPDYIKYPFVTADTETTGFGDYAEVIEVAMTEHDIEGNVGATIHYMCEPLCGFIPEGASKVNHIYFDDVKGYPTYLTGGVREDCAEFLKSREFVAHNAKYDIDMMRIKPSSVYDTLEKARKKWPQGRNNLKAVCNKLGIAWDDDLAHRATYDVLQTIKVFAKLNNPEGPKPLKIQTDLF